MSWPNPNEYSEAFRHPLRRFARPEWKRAAAALDDTGKPKVLRHANCDVYELRGAGGLERWGIGCFTSEPVGGSRRYGAINSHLREHGLTAFVETQFLEQGICIRGRWYPVAWSRLGNGKTLHEYVKGFLEFPDELKLLADSWCHLGCALEKAGVAHGNLTAATVVVETTLTGQPVLRLVDYDAVEVPGLEPAPRGDGGHEDYQHPARAANPTDSAAADRFGHLAILTALRALAGGGTALWERYDNHGNLLFTAGDFQDPSTSALFRELWHSESSTVRALAGLLVLAATGTYTDVPCASWIAEHVLRGGATRALTGAQMARVGALLNCSVPGGPNLELEPEFPAAPRSDRKLVATPDPMAEGISELPLRPRPQSEHWAGETRRSEGSGRMNILEPPPPLPFEHPLLRTYEIDAWMPEQVALMKLQGFIRDHYGKVTENIPGFIRVQMTDLRDSSLRQPPAILTWLGLMQAPPREPTVVAVMELCMVHHSTPTRQRVKLTVRLSPPDPESEPRRWDDYCEKMFCELRGYLIGSR
jgi:hypothetical protein